MIFLIMIEISLEVLHCKLVRESKFCLSFFNHFFNFRIEIRFEQNRSFFFNGSGIHVHAIYNKIKTKVECMYFN